MGLLFSLAVFGLFPPVAFTLSITYLKPKQISYAVTVRAYAFLLLRCKHRLLQDAIAVCHPIVFPVRDFALGFVYR